MTALNQASLLWLHIYFGLREKNTNMSSYEAKQCCLFGAAESEKINMVKARSSNTQLLLFTSIVPEPAAAQITLLHGSSDTLIYHYSSWHFFTRCEATVQWRSSDTVIVHVQC